MQLVLFPVFRGISNLWFFPNTQLLENLNRAQFYLFSSRQLKCQQIRLISRRLTSCSTRCTHIIYSPHFSETTEHQTAMQLWDSQWQRQIQHWLSQMQQEKEEGCKAASILRDLLHVNKSVSCAMRRCWLPLRVADLLGLWLSLTLWPACTVNRLESRGSAGHCVSRSTE